tara:strand:- start:115 stop:555 length:441 start_codon:yes stop_codon:yes gene_type:complete
MNKIILLILILSFQVDLYSANHVVKMLNQGAEGVMIFEPSVLKINPGDSVTFKSIDAAHNSASIPAMIPNNAQAWNSDLSRDITVNFNIPGVYVYQCTPHVMMAMIGVIQVGNDISNLDTIKAATTQFKTIFVMNQSRLDDYLSKI